MMSFPSITVISSKKFVMGISDMISLLTASVFKLPQRIFFCLKGVKSRNSVSGAIFTPNTIDVTKKHPLKVNPTKEMLKESISYQESA